jgi:hypothetical protein
MIKKKFLLFLAGLCVLPLYGQTRSFGDLFPAMDGASRDSVFSPDGLMTVSKNSHALQLSPAVPDLDIAAPVLTVLTKDPSFLVESLLVLPPGENGGVSLGDIYNALGQIRGLKGLLYHSATRGKDVPLFEDATRLEGPKKLSPIPDAPAAASVPPEETMYIRLRDINFGNSYYRAEITTNNQGLLFHLANFRTLSYVVIPVIRAEKFTAQMYIEPIAEGILIYSIAGAEVSEFVASMVDVPSAIRKRLEVIIEWLCNGIGISESG